MVTTTLGITMHDSMKLMSQCLHIFGPFFVKVISMLNWYIGECMTYQCTIPIMAFKNQPNQHQLYNTCQTSNLMGTTRLKNVCFLRSLFGSILSYIIISTRVVMSTYDGFWMVYQRVGMCMDLQSCRLN